MNALWRRVASDGFEEEMRRWIRLSVGVPELHFGHEAAHRVGCRH